MAFATTAATISTTAAASTTVATATATAASATSTTAAISTTTTAAAPTTAAAAAISAATTATRTLFARAGFVDGQRPAIERLAMELRDRRLRIGIIAHGDECKSARLAGELVLHQQHFRYRSRLREIILKVRLRCIEGEVAHVEFVAHVI
jgi:hypothetical protein